STAPAHPLSEPYAAFVSAASVPKNDSAAVPPSLRYSASAASADAASSADSAASSQAASASSTICRTLRSDLAASTFTARYRLSSRSIVTFTATAYQHPSFLACWIRRGRGRRRGD